MSKEFVDWICVLPENRNPTIRIYQIPLNEETRGLVFEGLESMQKETGGRIPVELYECVYEGKLNAAPEDVFTIKDIPANCRYDDMVQEFYDFIVGKNKNPFTYEHELVLKKVMDKICFEK